MAKTNEDLKKEIAELKEELKIAKDVVTAVVDDKSLREAIIVVVGAVIPKDVREELEAIADTVIFVEKVQSVVGGVFEKLTNDIFELSASPAEYSGDHAALVSYVATKVLGEEGAAEFLSIEDAHEASEILAQAVDALVDATAKEYEALDTDIEEIKETLCPASYIESGAGKQIRTCLVASPVKGQDQTTLEIKAFGKAGDIQVVEATYEVCAKELYKYADKHENLINIAERGKMVLNFNYREFEIIKAGKE